MSTTNASQYNDTPVTANLGPPVLVESPEVTDNPDCADARYVKAFIQAAGTRQTLEKQRSVFATAFGVVLKLGGDLSSKARSFAESEMSLPRSSSPDYATSEGLFRSFEQKRKDFELHLDVELAKDFYDAESRVAMTTLLEYVKLEKQYIEERKAVEQLTPTQKSD